MKSESISGLQERETGSETERLRHENELLKGVAIEAQKREQRFEDERRLLKIRAEDAEKRAVTDEMTGLFNRRGLYEAVELMSANNTKLSCLLLDIDNFKVINDTYGHAAGDQVIKDVAKYLSETVRKADIVSRLGGEEFAVVFRRTDAEGIMNKYHQRDESEETGHPRINIESTFVDKNGDQQTVKVTLSGGVVDFEPGTTISTTLKKADSALYDAKELGKDRIIKAE